MAWFKNFRRRPDSRRAPLALERLETRTLLDATATLASGLLSVVGGPGSNRILLMLDAAHNQLVLSDGGQGIIGRFDNAAVTQINIDVSAGTGTNVVRIGKDVLQSATISGAGGTGNDFFYAGGGTTLLKGGNGSNRLVAGPGPTTMGGGSGANQLFGGSANDTFVTGPGSNLFYGVKNSDSATPGPNVQIFNVLDDPAPALTLTAAQVGTLLQRAAGASSSTDGIIAVVDRAGNILGVRVESGVSPLITGSPEKLAFAIDGAVSLARTAAFFSNNQAPLTSRTIQFISQSTITQREVNSDPNAADPFVNGPGLVAPVGVGGHFPPGVMFTPQVDLFEIELTNRDYTLSPTNIRFDINPAFLAPGVGMETTTGTSNFNLPLSYGTLALGLTTQNRGIGTLPGGIPLFENGQLVGGIGVFFPGTTGFASEENSVLSSTFDPTKPDRSQEAEYIAFAAAGGTAGSQAAIAQISGQLPPLPGFQLPSGRIDLVGITLDIYGPGGRMGADNLLKYGAVNIHPGSPNDGMNQPLSSNPMDTLRDGVAPPEGFIVNPQNGLNPGTNLTAADVTQIINQGIAQSNQTRAQIRLPLGSTARFVFAISDLEGNIIGLYREPDATVFSIDVAVAKARNVAYYDNPALLQPQDQLPGFPPGIAFTNRTFRYLAEPRFPEGIDGAPPGPFSILNDGGVNPFNGLQVGPPLPASAFQSVLGYDAFHPETNFRATAAGIDPAKQNGIVFFPGSMPLYKIGPNGQPVLVGGLGVSGDGVDEDDVATFAAAQGFFPPTFLQVDQFFFNRVRLPFQKFDRNPEDL
jgi:uncharacterized protein GlcG (DUF336 family)